MINRPPGSTTPTSAILTFLIADVRGYTAFTRSAGDEAAARLAAAFAEIVREGVEAFGGEVIELRGDEALAVFGSARNGLRAASALQSVFAVERAIHPLVPLAVGIGLDAGEAVPVEAGYRGAALNTAARLCSVAAAGEILATEGVVHLAGATDGLQLRRRVGLELKGLDAPIDAVEVVPGEAAPTGAADGPSPLPPELEAFSPLVGRDREARALRWAWRTSRGADPAIRVVAGPAGAGKTRLIAEAALVAAADGAPIRYASAAWEASRFASTADAALAAPGPNLVVLDDLDAGPTAAVAALERLGSRATTHGLVILALSSSGAVDADLERAVAAVAGDAETIRLAPLDANAAAGILALYGTEAPDPIRLNDLLEASGGLPARIHVLAAEEAQAEATRRLGGATSRAAAGRIELRRFEAEVAANLFDLQLARERTRTLRTDPRAASGLEACPFMGLASFDVADADLFFGRERLVAEMVGRLAGASFLGIVGPSGSGKSSAMRAGLLPALATAALPGSDRWVRAVLRPGSDPLREVDRAVFAALDPATRARLASGSDALTAALAAIPDGATLLVAVDQFEEVFTAADATARNAFVSALVGAAASGRAVVIVAVRADFYGRCAEHERLAELLAANHLLVGPMNADEYRRAIEGPARRAGLRVEPALVDELVADVLDQPGGLPLLSTALVELWEHREGRTLRHATYESTGGVSGAVARLAEAAYGRLDDTAQHVARSIFLRLVAGDEDAIVRRRVPLAELDAETNDDVRRTLAVLTDARLVTIGAGNVEVAHEALLREWPRLAAWIEEDREGRRLRARLAESSREWAITGRDASELYRGARLAAALDWTAGHTLELNELEREFVTESRAATERETTRQARTNRRLRGLLAATAIGLVVAIGAGALAFVQKQAADRATADANAQRVAADEQRAAAQQAAVAADAQRLGALALATKDLDLSLLLARQGVALDDSAVTRADLLADLDRSPAAIRISRPLPGRPLQIFGSDDGSTLVVDNNGGEIAVVDGATGTTRYTRGSSDHPVFAGATSDGNVWVETDAGPPAPPALEILDGHTGSVIRSFRSPLANLASFGISPDVRLLADVPADGRSMVIFDTTTGHQLRRVSARPGTSIINVNGFADGHWLASTISGSMPAGPPFGHPGTLDWWGPSGTRPLASVPVPDVTTTYAVSPDGTELSIDNDPEDGRETVVDLGTGKGRTLRGQHTGHIQGSAFSPDGSILVTGGDDKVAIVWDVKSGALKETLAGHNGRVNGPAVGTVGGVLTAWTISLDGSMITWDLSGTRRLGQPFEAGPGVPSIAPIFSPATFEAVSPDGRFLLVGDDHGAVVLDLATRAIVHSLTHSATDFPTNVAWSPDGSRVALTGDGSDGVELFDTTSWQTVRGPLPGPAGDRPQGPNEPPVGPTKGREPNAAEAIAFSRDSSRVVGGFDDGSIWSWDARTGAPIGQPLHLPGPVLALAVRADGTLAAAFNVFGAGGTGNKGEAAVFDPGATTPRLTLDVDGDYGRSDAVAFSPDGRTLATGGGTGDVRLWDVATGAGIGRHVSANAGWVLSIAWTADGRKLLTGGTDGTVRLIDVATTSPAGTLPGIDNQAVVALLLPDGRHAVGTYVTGQALEWSIDPADWATLACSVAGRTLSQDEWSLYVPNQPYRPACGG